MKKGLDDIVLSGPRRSKHIDMGKKRKSDVRKFQEEELIEKALHSSKKENSAISPEKDKVSTRRSSFAPVPLNMNRSKRDEEISVIEEVLSVINSSSHE